MAAEHVRALGEQIRLRREELGMTQDEVARQMSGSVDGQRISKWERGENRPRDESLEDLARVLQTTAMALLAPMPERDETPTPFAGQDAIAARLDAIEQAIADARREREEQASRIEGLLMRQDSILASIEARLGEQRTVRDELSDLIEARGREIVEGRPAAEPDPQPAPRQTSAAKTKRAAKPRTA